MNVPEPVKKVGRVIKDVGLFIGSGVCEKDRHKTQHFPTERVLSASRIVVLALTAVWIRTVWMNPELLAEWPVATAGVFFCVALPVVGALKSTDPEKVLQWAKGVVERLGSGS